jgi:hypothetical protein
MAITTTHTAQEVFSVLAPHLDATDGCYVFEVDKDFAGRGPLAATQWLDRRLGRR